jgi:hypothetical protein
MSQEELPSAPVTNLPSENATEEPGVTGSVIVAAPGVWGFGAIGLAAGVGMWIVLEVAFPVFSVPEEITAKIPLSFPPPGLMQEFKEAKQWADAKNSMTAGMLMGMLAGLLLSTHLQVFQHNGVVREKGSGTFCAKHPSGRSGKRCLTPFSLRVLACTIWGGVSGLLAGIAGQALLSVLREFTADDSMARIVGVHTAYWSILGMGTGMGLALFADGFRHAAALVCQGLLAGVLTALVYVPIAGTLFPVDDAERLVPESAINCGVWSILGLAILAVLMGTALHRRNGAPSSSETSGSAGVGSA